MSGEDVVRKSGNSLGWMAAAVRPALALFFLLLAPVSAQTERGANTLPERAELEGDEGGVAGGNLAAYDVAPCGGNGAINLDDILALLSAFAGNYACSCGAPNHLDAPDGSPTGVVNVNDDGQVNIVQLGSVISNFTNPLRVFGSGTDIGGAGSAPEVVARFKNDRGVGTNTAISIDAENGEDSILYLAESNPVGGTGFAWWDIRHDSSATTGSHNFNIRYQGATGVNDVVMVINPTGQMGLQNNTPAFPLEVGTNSSNGNGAHVTNGGTWTNGSSRDWKENFQDIDKKEVLRKVAHMPLTQWQYKGEDRSMHIGPTAQDFRAAFGLGHDERYITTIDSEGVALAAIQGLNEVVREKDCAIDELREQNAELNARLDRLEAAIASVSSREVSPRYAFP